MQPLTKSVDLIIPCYNPPLHWQEYLLERVLAFAESVSSATLKVVLVNDGSTTGISEKQLEVLKQKLPGLLYLSLPTNLGKGAALRAGVMQSGADFCIFTDIDFPYTNQSMVNVWNALESENDVVVGYRDHTYYHNVPVFRRLISKLFRVLLKRIVKLKVDDTQCGLKGFGIQGKNAFLQTQTMRYLFDFEFVKKVSSNPSLRLVPVPVQLRKGVEFTKMSLKVLLKELHRFIWLLIKT
jgi:glycosyltransferase involved in cell wall biosynthesis